MPRFTIYRHIHDESGRSYIGLTQKTMMHRWNQHCAQSAAFKGVGRSHFANAIRTYGKNAFSHEILEVCNSLEEANVREQFWIWTYDTTNPIRGFNIKAGGAHTPHPIKNPWDRPEYRSKCIEQTKRNTQNAQARANNKASLNTPESKAKRSAISKELMEDPARRSKFAGCKEWTENRRKSMKLVNKRRTQQAKVMIVCALCGIESQKYKRYLTDSVDKFCSQACQRVHERNESDRLLPSKEELAKLYEFMSINAMSRMLKISHKTLSSKLTRMGIHTS